MRELLFKNLGLKILSLGFAVSLWLFVNLKATAERDLKLPVKWVNLPNFLEITNPVNDFVRVRVSGPRRILSHMDPNRFPVILDLSDARVGLRDYQITDKMVTLLPGLRATVLQPDTIQFRFDLVVTKEVPVQPHIVGEPPEGFVLASVTCVPPRIEIVGAQSEVQTVSRVQTEPILVGDLREDLVREVKLVLKRLHVWTSPEVQTVKVEIRVQELETVRRVADVVVEVRGVAAGPHLEARPATVDVVLEGPRGLVMRIHPDRVLAHVSLAGRDLPAEPVPVEVSLPVEGIRAWTEPARVRLVRPMPREDRQPLEEGAWESSSEPTESEALRTRSP